MNGTITISKYDQVKGRFDQVTTEYFYDKNPEYPETRVRELASRETREFNVKEGTSTEIEFKETECFGYVWMAKHSGELCYIVTYEVFYGPN